MGFTVDSEGTDVVRVHLGTLRSQVSALRRLADAMRDHMKRVDLEVPDAIGNHTGVVIHNAGLLRTKNQRALDAVDALVTDLAKACGDLESVGRKAGYLLEDADWSSGRDIDRAVN